MDNLCLVAPNNHSGRAVHRHSPLTLRGSTIAERQADREDDGADD
jgi:hypothetical protein